MNMKYLYCSYQLGNSKGFRGSVPETERKTKYMFLIINLNITEPGTGHVWVRTSPLNGDMGSCDSPRPTAAWKFPSDLLLCGRTG